MTWRDQLLKASFRGVEFHYREAGLDGGRNVVESEFPFREDGATEDTGRKLRHYRMSAYVLGTDYFGARNDLLSALEGAGEGSLIHPYLGLLFVRVVSFRMHEGQDAGGMADFDIDFVEVGAKLSPTSAVDTAGASDTAAAAAQKSASGIFQAVYTLEKYGTLIASYANNAVSTLTDALGTLTDGISAVVETVQTLQTDIAQIQASVLSTVSLATAITGYFSTLGDAIIGNLSDGSVDETTNSRGGVTVGDPSYGLAGMAAWGGDLAAIAGDTDWKLQAADNQSVLIVLVQSCAVAQIARIYAATVFDGSQDAETARTQIVGFMQALAISAADNGDTAAYQAWMAAMQASSDDLTTRGKQLPDVVTVTFHDPTPAVVVAQTLYADAARAGELIVRNGAQHPLFMPVTIEALSQ